MRRTRISKYFAAILLAVAAFSCHRGTYYSGTTEMKDGQWSMYDPAGFTCIFDDTLQVYDINLSVRTSTAYPYRNLFLFIETTFPSGFITADTVQAMLTDEKGRWLGRGAGDIRELTIPYKSYVYFPEKGEYHFSVIQGMRDTILKGVYDLEFRVTKRDQ
jgi:gliding motility-associated lipoprotein GldH